MFHHSHPTGYSSRRGMSSSSSLTWLFLDAMPNKDWADGQYDAPIGAGDANIVVTKLADYLKSVNY
jgi:hypothetical protein